MASAVGNTNVDNINNFTAEGRAKSAADAASDALFSNYEQFIKLLTVQLENQDPTKPLETNEMTAQIAQLSQVEQQINSNKNLETLIGLYNQSQFFSTAGYIGRMVEAPGNLGSLQDGNAVFVYALASDAETVNVTITDADDNVVFEGNGTKLAGRNQYIWDGKNNNGDTMPDGTYKIAVVAKDVAGDDITVGLSSAGKVTSVETIDGAAYLALGDILVPFNEILSVREMPKFPANSNTTTNTTGDAGNTTDETNEAA